MICDLYQKPTLNDISIMMTKKELKVSKAFKFKEFEIHQDQCAMKIGTDGILLGAWASMDNVESALDIGAGTGVIGIMLAQRSVSSIIHAVEIDTASWKQAKENMAISPWNDRLTVFNESIQDYSKLCQDEYDLIISNPPFFSGGTLSDSNDRNNVRHTIKLPNGDLLSAARKLMKPNGRFCVILPFMEGLRFVERAEHYNLYCTKMTEVKPKAESAIERLLLRFENNPVKNMVKDSLVIQNNGSRNDYTHEYTALTKDFYLNM